MLTRSLGLLPSSDLTLETAGSLGLYGTLAATANAGTATLAFQTAAIPRR